MPSKKVVQDIVPSERRSIRNIPIEHEVAPPVRSSRAKPIKQPVRRRVVREEELEEEGQEEAAEVVFVPRRKPKQKRNTGKYAISFVVLFLSIAAIGFALTLSYSKAIVTITPKTATVEVNGTYTAKKSSAAEGLGYEVVTVTDELTQSIPATAGALVQTKAKGNVTIYNNFSATPQTLVAGTRLSDSNGLIYRTAASVSVPGKKTTAGSIVVAVVADQAGAEYNVTLANAKDDLKIVGYKGTPKYDGFYARFKTDMIGGFSGNKMTIDPVARKAATDALQASMKAGLESKLAAAVPEGYILYPGAYTLAYDIPEPVMKDGTSAEIVVKGSLHGALFKESTLLASIAGSEIKKFPSDTYNIIGMKDLDFKLSNSKDFSAQKGTPMIFNIKGSFVIEGTLSEMKLTEDLKGIALKDSAPIFAKYTAISDVYSRLTPFWLRSFPNSSERIIIEYKSK